MYIFWILETGKKTLQLKALPTANWPKKSHDTPQIRCPDRTNNLMDKYTDNSKKTKKKFYKSYNELCKRLSSMKCIENNSWEKAIENDQIYLTQKHPLYCLPTINVLVDNDYYFTGSVYAWHLPDDN